MTRRKDPRSARLPVSAGELPAFAPVPRQYQRHDGWTPERQRRFIEALADSGSVEAAARAVDMSSVGAYQLRRSEGAEEFRAAWEAALALGVQRIEDVAMDRALNGVEEPLYSYGKLIGSRTRYNDRLLMFILRNRAPERFAAGGGPKGLNAVSQMQLEKLKKQWIAEHEASKPNVTAAEVKASIDRKIMDIRRRIERERPKRRAVLSEETLAAFAHFAQLRDRDLAAADADERTRKMVGGDLNTPTDFYDPPAAPALPAPEREGGVDKNENWQRPPPGWGEKPPPPPPKTTWTLKDDSFDP